MHRAKMPAGAHDGHHTADPPEGPSLRCRCSASATALALLIMGSGLLTPAFSLPLEIAGGPVPAASFTARTHAPRLDTPPPRVRSLPG
jgi:hypothetical protein